MSYSGYLKPHLPLILSFAAKGLTPTQIARELFKQGFRAYYLETQNVQPQPEERHISSMAGIIDKCILNPPSKLRPHDRAKWKVWTPEKQAQEIDQEGY